MLICNIKISKICILALTLATKIWVSLNEKNKHLDYNFKQSVRLFICQDKDKNLSSHCIGLFLPNIIYVYLIKFHSKDMPWNFEQDFLASNTAGHH